MASEISHRHSATGETLYATIRTDARQMWNTAGTPAFEALTVANWGDYDIALSESPASSYFYVGTFPAISGNMVAGWYWVDIFKRAAGSPAISDVIQVSYFGYWDGTTFKWWGEDTIAVGGTVQTAGDVVAVANSIKTDTGTTIPALIGNIASTGSAAYEAMESVALNGSAETLTFAATDTANGTYHQIADNAGAMNVVYETVLRPDEVAVGLIFKGRLQSSPATGDNVALQIYDWVGAAWVPLATITGITGTTDVTLTPALVGKYTGTGANVGKVQIRFYKVSGLTSATLNVDQLVVTKSNTSRSVGYANGAIWVKTGGTAGTVRDYNGVADRPCPWADALTLDGVLGFGRYTITPGSTIALDATDLIAAVMTGRSYALALDGQDISKSYFEGVESLSGIGTTATGEAIFVDCHVGTVTLGEFDFVRCHLHGTITLAAASKYYRMHNCTGIENAVVEFGAAAQTLALSEMSGAITITGMTAGDTLLVDGNGVLTLGPTCNGGTVHISGNIELTNSGTGQTITYGATKFGNMAHGGAVATITTASGSLGATVAGIAADYGKAGEAETARVSLAAQITSRTVPTTGGLGAEFTAAGLALAPVTAAAPSAADNAAATRSLLDSVHGAGLWTSSVAGGGASHETITVLDALSNPVADCEIWLTSDADGDTIVAGPLVTDDDGTAEFLLDVGVTYYVWRRKSGVNFTNPATIVSVGD